LLNLEYASSVNILWYTLCYFCWVVLVLFVIVVFVGSVSSVVVLDDRVYKLYILLGCKH